MSAKIELIRGSSFTDYRGTLAFVNQFDFKNVVRFYQVIQTDTSVVRAWQGHKVEHKHFYVAKGAFAIAGVAVDNWETPSFHLTPDIYILTDREPSILSIPPGFANGIKAIIPSSVLLVYSNLTLKESEGDRYSFNPNLWLDWNAIDTHSTSKFI